MQPGAYGSRKLCSRGNYTVFSQCHESPGGCRDVSVCTVIHFLTKPSVLIGQNLFNVLSLSVMPEKPFWPLMASSKRAPPEVCKTDTENESTSVQGYGAAPSSVWGFASIPLMCQYEVQLHMDLYQNIHPWGLQRI